MARGMRRRATETVGVGSRMVWRAVAGDMVFSVERKKSKAEENKRKSNEPVSRAGEKPEDEYTRAKIASASS